MQGSRSWFARTTYRLRASAVIPMQTQGSEPPLLLIHALGGRVIGYNDLLRHLKRTQPVYGVKFDDMTGYRATGHLLDVRYGHL